MPPLATTAVAQPPAHRWQGTPARASERDRQPITAASIVAAMDVVVMLGALLLAALGPEIARGPVVNPLSLTLTVQDIVLLTGLAAGTLLTFKAAGLYDATTVRRWREELIRVVASATVLGGIVLLFLVVGGSTPLKHNALIRFWIAGTGLAVAARGARARLMRSRCRRVVIVGSGARALRLCRDVRSHYAEIQETIRTCERVGVKLMYRADIFDLALARPHLVSPSSRVELRVVTEDGIGIALKRGIDVVGALAGLVVLGPLLLAVAVAIRLTDGGPVLFAQQRYGLNRRRFRMLKFRTMVQNADKLQASLEAVNEAKGPVFKIARDPRITPLGRVLRRTSIDELPQLLNVLGGDMSLVGPRPLPLRDVARFTRPADMRRFSVRPGITGLWQVSGRSNLDFETWITLDLQYIDNWSLALDFTIFARTIPAVLRGTGAS